MATIDAGMEIVIEYTLTVDGNVVDTSQGKEPLKYTHGQGQLIPGLEKQLVGLSAGESKSVTVAPEEGYGVADPSATVKLPKEQFGAGETPQVGMSVSGKTQDGRPFQATIAAVGEKEITLDFNHPLAGKTLHFQIKILEVNAPEK